MGMLGSSALAMWWEVAPEVRAEFGHWHAHEHYPERLRIPGFRRASRWVDADGGPGVFQCYELESHAVLGSPAYLERLNAPTPWSTRMMPHHRHMVRSQCRVLASVGGAVAGYAATLRVSPAAEVEPLVERLEPLLQQLACTPGLTGAHFLRHEAPAIAPTREQQIRGGDAYADCVLLLTAYDSAALDVALDAPLSDGDLASLGVAPGVVRNRYRLSQSALPGELAGIAPR